METVLALTEASAPLKTRKTVAGYSSLLVAPHRSDVTLQTLIPRSSGTGPLLKNNKPKTKRVYLWNYAVYMNNPAQSPGYSVSGLSNVLDHDHLVCLLVDFHIRRRS